MDPNRPRFKYELLVLVGMLLTAGVIWLFRVAGNPFSSSPSPPPVRQSIPPPEALELPPVAPVPSTEHPFFSQINPQESPQPTESEKSHRNKKSKHQPKIPTRWEIINQYRQVFELDMKYIQIAVASDRYGYRNQAIVYYRKYLSVSPTGPYANQVRQRLSQLETSP